ncbi:MAG: twin-arginine translocation signal domain-containing protein, partial [Sedimentisphaerales bacterium]|nr:twin-arginine translocation signal domain-containing protein [Sedimentisphaerales bacterium]
MSENICTRRGFLKAAGAGLVALSMPGIPAFSKEHNKPNILFIFADDQCFETLRSLGNDEVEDLLDCYAGHGMLDRDGDDVRVRDRL